MNTSTEIFNQRNASGSMVTTSVHDELRKPGTTRDGLPFDEATITAVWEKAQKEFGFYFYRRDVCGTVVAKHEYGKKTRYGWEIDHIIPISMNGTDDLDNLQALHWENNLAKGDNYPVWDGKQTS